MLFNFTKAKLCKKSKKLNKTVKDSAENTNSRPYSRLMADFVNDEALSEV